MKVLKFIDAHMEEIILVLLLMVISCIMMLQVIMRFLFKSALSWAEEISVQMYIVSVFFSVGYCIRNKKMLRVEIVESLLPAAVRRVLQTLAELFNLAVWGYLFYAAFGTIAALHRTHALLSATHIPQYFMYILYTIALGLAVFRSIQMLYRYLFRPKGGEAV